MKTGLLFFVFTLFITVFVMGGGNQASRGTAGQPVIDRSNFNQLGTYPLVRNKTNITVMCTNFTTVDPDENWFTQYYENLSGVHVNWIPVPVDQFKEKLNLAFAADDKIDFISSGNNSQSVFSLIESQRYANQKLILPVQDLIQSDTVHMKKNLAAYDGWEQLLTQPDGNMYALPCMVDMIQVQYYVKMWVNREFVKNLKMDFPTTIDEFHDMLVAFKNMDANGNGDLNDEIPFAGAIDNFGCKVDPWIMNAYIYDDGSNRVFIDDNKKVVIAYTRPEFQEGLRTLNRWYSEGLISRDSFTQSRAVRHQLNSQKYESIIGAIPNIHCLNLGDRDAGQPLRMAEYEPIKPLKGPRGLQITRSDYYDRFMTSGGLRNFIPSTCSNPALIMRWCDYFHTMEGLTLGYWGGENISWEKAGPGTVGENGLPATIQTINIPQGARYYDNYAWGGIMPEFQDKTFRNIMAKGDIFDPNDTQRDPYDRYLNIKTIENYVDYGIELKNLFPPLFYADADVTDMARYTTDINTYVEESIAKFITGDLNINTQWNEFQTQLRNLGIDRYLQLMQNTYDKSQFAR